MLRVFFALQPTLAQSENLSVAVAPLIVGLGGQPVPASNLHATLCFVGAVARRNEPKGSCRADVDLNHHRPPRAASAQAAVHDVVRHL